MFIHNLRGGDPIVNIETAANDSHHHASDLETLETCEKRTATADFGADAQQHTLAPRNLQHGT